MSTFRIPGIALVLAFGALGVLSAQPARAVDPIVMPLMLKQLADVPGREVLMITVDYPPGTVEHTHRHDAHAFVYVLEGTIVMGVRGGKEVTLTPGQIGDDGFATVRLDGVVAQVQVLEPNRGAGVPAKLVGPFTAIGQPGRVGLTAVLSRLELKENA